jgi:nucleoside-diphosphate-sugar epimerase
MMNKKVIMTGAAGNIGNKIRSFLGEKYSLTLIDRAKLDCEKTIQADLTYYDQRWVQHIEEKSTVLHLAANPHTNASWEELIPDNIDALLNICHSCVEKDVDRLIFASSCHTMAGYRDKSCDLITADMPPWPDCNYGISKLVGERICKSFSDRYSLSVLCLRIGWVPRGKQPGLNSNDWLKSLWLSDRDLIQIVEKSIEARGITFIILYAMSNNGLTQWDLASTMRVLNYKPQDGSR